MAFTMIRSFGLVRPRAMPVLSAVAQQQRSFAKKAKDSDVLEFEALVEYKTHNCDAPDTKLNTTKKELVQFYEDMYTIRRMEIAADTLYKQKKIRGFLHLYNGQEAVCVGVNAAMQKGDAITTAYRDHGWAYCRGHTPGAILSELLGKSTGCSKGRGGSMHMYRGETNFYGGNAIVGAQVPMAAGIALAQKYNNTNHASIVGFGDGAANQGQLFETFNMAKIWNLPVIFLVENNRYGMGTSDQRASAATEFYKRGDYVPGIRSDGMCVFTAKKAAEYCLQHCRDGKGPIVLEMMTYRYVGHSMSDPGTTYRTRDEVNEIRKMKDPIDQVKQRILNNEVLSADELKDIDKRIRQELTEAQKFAEESPEPSLDSLFDNVLTHPTFCRTCELPNSFDPAMQQQ